MTDREITIIDLMADNGIASGQTEYAAQLLEMHELYPVGNFSMHLELDVAATAGTATVFYEVTNVKNGDMTRFIKPLGGSDIFTNFAKTDGVDADGRDLQDFNAETCYQVRIGVTATGGAVVIKKLIAAVQ